jgi:hypothetical protein
VSRNNGHKGRDRHEDGSQRLRRVPDRSTPSFGDEPDSSSAVSGHEPLHATRSERHRQSPRCEQWFAARALHESWQRTRRCPTAKDRNNVFAYYFMTQEDLMMRVPTQAPVVSRSISVSRTRRGAIEPSSCDFFKAIECAAAVVACGATCIAGPEACIPCLAGIGAEGCLDCVM